MSPLTEMNYAITRTTSSPPTMADNVVSTVKPKETMLSSNRGRESFKKRKVDKNQHLKIACFVLLCMVVVAPHTEAALSCGQVQSGIAPCVPYLQGCGPLGNCCGGIKGLLGVAKTPADRKTACTCLKLAANAVKGLDVGKASGLSAACGVNIPYQISPSVDCSKGCRIQ